MKSSIAYLVGTIMGFNIREYLKIVWTLWVAGWVAIAIAIVFTAIYAWMVGDE